MIKKITITLILLVVILVGSFMVISNASLIPEGSNEEKVIAILESNQCMQCHENGVEAPFYASVPVIGTTVKNDMTKGLLHTDLKQFVEAIKSPSPTNEAMLAKLETSMAKQTMPPLKYKAVHWGSNITDDERDVILTWVAEERSRYGSTGSAAEFANELVRPVDLIIPTDSQKVALGVALYNDKRLSDDGTVSCATCHVLTKGGTDNLQYSEGVRAQFGDVNAPTVFNAVYNHLQFWDGRAATLAEQAAGPPVNPVEMGSHTWDQICDRIKEDKDFVKTFTAVYPNGVTLENVTDAIAEYEKTLITPNSRFDKYLRGDMAAMTSEEIEGFNLAKANDCFTCHVGTNLGGQSFEYIGLYGDYLNDRGNIIKADNGRFNHTANNYDMHRFKTPTLRNIALTAPYMHDGTVKELKDVVAIMGKYQVKNGLTDDATNKITLYLGTLTGELNGQPLL